MAKGIRSKRMRKNRAVIRLKNAVKERERLIRTVPKSWLQYGGVDLATTEIKDEAFVIDRLKPVPGREPPRVDVFSSLFRSPISDKALGEESEKPAVKKESSLRTNSCADAGATASTEECECVEADGEVDGDGMDVELVGEERASSAVGPFSARTNRFPPWLKTRTTRRLRLGVRRARKLATRARIQKHRVNPAARIQPKRLTRVLA